MQNLQVYNFLDFELPQSSLPINRSLYVSYPEPAICTISAEAEDGAFIRHELRNLAVEKAAQRVSLNLRPIAFSLHCDAPHVFSRDGQIFSIQNDTIEHVGDCTNEDPAKNGLLAAAGSPDGCLLAIVSPISVSVIDAEHDLLAEIPCDDIASEAAVSWRSDGEFFVVVRRRVASDSGEDKQGAVHGFVSSRACDVVRNLDAEAIDGMKCIVDWEPRVGGMITVATDKKLSFFERNGLRHTRTDFDPGHAVTLIAWSRDSRILLLYGDGEVSFWLRRNGCWYCKKFFQMSGVVGAHWDEDEPQVARIVRSNGCVHEMKIYLDSSTPLPLASGMHLGVVHGSSVILTNLSAGIIPPPMNHGVLGFAAGVDGVCALEDTNSLGVVRCDGLFILVDLNKRLGRPQLSVNEAGNDSIVQGREQWILSKENDDARSCPLNRLPILLRRNLLVIVKRAPLIAEAGAVNDNVEVLSLQKDNGLANVLGKYTANGRVHCMIKSVVSPSAAVLLSSKGLIVRLSVDDASGECVEVDRMSIPIDADGANITEVFAGSRRVLVTVHDRKGGLHVAETASGKLLRVSEECTSYIVHEGFLNFTTRSHLFYSLPFMRGEKKQEEKDQQGCSILAYLDSGETDDGELSAMAQLPEGMGAIRPIDRGSVIVAALPNNCSVILQAPRGNLECVAPRPIVQSIVEKLTKAREYGKAFALCRKQRLDMNYIVNVDFDSFLENMSTFVTEVNKGDHLGVFMTLLEGSSEKIDTVCKCIVQELRARNDNGTYTNAILTGLMRQSTRDMQGALKEVRLAMDRWSIHASGAVDLLFILTKSEKFVYEHALGVYDIGLARFVAEASQLDPADYTPELLRFGGLERTKMCFEIDMRLERYDAAVRHLHVQGTDTYQRCVDMCLKHSLFETGLELFEGNEAICKVILEGYGKQLEKLHRYDEAAARFVQIKDFASAYRCYLAGGKWQLALDAVGLCNGSEEEKRDMYSTIAEHLIEGGQLKEGASVMSGFLDDTSGAIEYLVEAEEWESGFETIARASRKQDVTELRNKLVTGVKDALETLVSMVEGNKGKLHERGARLLVVRAAKEAMRAHVMRRERTETDSDVFTATTSSTLSNFSDITFTSKSSATSLYKTSESETGMLSSGKLEKAAMRRKRKEGKKRIRQGHPREEEALVRYLQTLIPGQFVVSRAEGCARALVHIDAMEDVQRLKVCMQEYVGEALSLPKDILGDGEGDMRAYLEQFRRGLWCVAGL